MANSVHRSQICCPKCERKDTIVLDSRGVVAATHIYRRRKCVKCGHRFSTYETIDPGEPRTKRHVLRDLHKVVNELHNMGVITDDTL